MLQLYISTWRLDYNISCERIMIFPPAYFFLKFYSIYPTLIFFICKIIQLAIKKYVINDGNDSQYFEIVSVADIFTSRN